MWGSNWGMLLVICYQGKRQARRGTAQCIPSRGRGWSNNLSQKGAHLVTAEYHPACNAEENKLGSLSQESWLLEGA